MSPSFFGTAALSGEEDLRHLWTLPGDPSHSAEEGLGGKEIPLPDQDNKHDEVQEEQEVASGKAEDIHDVMSRLVKHETPYFLWTIKRDVVDYHNLNSDQMLNHYGKTGSFTTKIGLCVNMRSLPWFVQANPDAFFPRCYSLCTESEKQEFVDDFRRTMASSILKWVVNHHSCPRSKTRSWKEEARPDEEDGRTDLEGAGEKCRSLPGQLVDTACRVCQAYLGQREHEDIDGRGSSVDGLSEAEWSNLTQQYYALARGEAFISSSRNYFSQCQALLNKIKSVNPQTEIDGLRNIWIIKPAAKSRGRDIVCMDRVEDILALVAADRPPSRDNRWVVQKYIETPLLIYDTKFDIRQWFLVTDWNPLTIWFYKESYLRFSTQRFSLDCLDSAIHLCNNAIQKHLQNDKGRNPMLPGHNMWSSARFQEYLQGRGRGAVWGSLIYPSMKRAITHAMKMAQGHVEARRNSFELYGADFVLGRDFRPWLIEINSSPTMHPSTPVTAQLCAQVQEDTIKVVVDRRLDRNCDIGNFELLWRQPAVELPPFSVSDLCVEGVSMRRAKRQIPPIPTIDILASLPEAQLLKVPHPSALLDLAGGPHCAPMLRDRTLGDRKVSVSLWPPTAETGCGARLVRPACSWQPMDSAGLRRVLVNALSTQHVDLDSPRVQPLALMPRSLRTGAGAPSGLPPAPGRRNNATPCLVCRCSPSLRPCKRCGSFSASILQGSCFVRLRTP
ncbi:protein monoglycylase TTLL8 isoform X2 [Cavia porcellus]|uniref:protein monoglycylase TTLL8 isoform X2 n=1 Tax=Cavia porcellus TaxID=10141 RepID=UPI002FE09C7C